MNFRNLIAFAAAGASVASVMAAPASRMINDGWTFRQGRSDNWFEATVPGTVHTDLLANELIEDPFFRLNERSVQWVDKEDWMYKTNLVATPAEVDAANQELVFHGLDTYADVYLNHQRILEANNMHRTWRCNVRGILKEGDNLLEVYFHSPIKVDLPKFDMYDYAFNTGPDQSQNGGIFNKTLSVFARKAGYHYGWDWGPRLVTSGIWRPVELLTWNDRRISEVQHQQRSVDSRRARLHSVVEIQSDDAQPGATVAIKADGRTLASRKVDLQPGTNRVELDYEVKSPRLWWSNGLGEPYLYDFATTVTPAGAQTADDTHHRNIGLRSLRLVHEPDADGHTFYFELNGKPVFAKGVDMVPLNNFLPRVTHAKYDSHVLDAKAVNMNMIRVWGGGVYEDDYFYDLCDRNGMMVWQDFMFACSTYPADSAFMANIRAEAVDNVKRLRDHACLALWCGNNECQDVYYGWGGKHRYYQERGVDSLTTAQFRAMYFECLPDVVNEYGGGTPYWPSSPFAFEDTPSDGLNGDAHYWGVWHGRDSIGQYNNERARFYSEYGFQSFPEFESVKQYAPNPRDWSITSEAMMSHQRAGSYANGLIKTYMEREYRTPDDFPTFLYVGQILQGDAIKTAIESHRRNMPFCMGTLVWQHNDCWPVASWAGRDYYGRWKAQQYFSRAAYDDILVSPLLRGDSLTVTLVNDRRSPIKGQFKLRVIDIDGNELSLNQSPLKADPLSSRVVYSGPVAPLLDGRRLTDALFTVEFADADGRAYRNIGYGAHQGDMNYRRPAISLNSSPAADGSGYDVTVATDIFARGVFLSIEGIDNFFSDNYFDLLPGESRTIHVRSSLAPDEFRRQLKAVTLGDTYADLPAPSAIHSAIGTRGDAPVKNLGGD